jgi:hypothetical protein
MRRPFLLILLMIALAGCSVGAAPTPTPLPGSVTIRHPQSGAFLYAPTLYFYGSGENLTGNQFRLTAVTASDETIVDTVITVENGTWSYEIANPNVGDPIEVAINALPAAGGAELDSVSVVLATEAQRPEGVFGTIISPIEGETVGGESIPVSGTASGLFEGTMNLGLETPDGEEFSGIVITVENPGMMDEVPWQADLATNDYRGPAVLRAYYHSAKDGTVMTLATVPITISEAAG